MTKYRTLEFKLQRRFCAKLVEPSYSYVVPKWPGITIINVFARGVRDLDGFTETNDVVDLLEQKFRG